MSEERLVEALKVIPALPDPFVEVSMAEPELIDGELYQISRQVFRCGLCGQEIEGGAGGLTKKLYHLWEAHRVLFVGPELPKAG